MALDITNEEKQSLQHDILTTKTSENPLFTSHSIASLNKSLDTADKRIVGAINELKKGSAQTVTIVNDGLNSFLEVIGDFKNTPQLKEDILGLGNTMPTLLGN